MMFPFVHLICMTFRDSLWRRPTGGQQKPKKVFIDSDPSDRSIRIADMQMQMHRMVSMPMIGGIGDKTAKLYTQIAQRWLVLLWIFMIASSSTSQSNRRNGISVAIAMIDVIRTSRGNHIKMARLSLTVLYRLHFHEFCCCSVRSHSRLRLNGKIAMLVFTFESIVSISSVPAQFCEVNDANSLSLTTMSRIRSCGLRFAEFING